MSDSERKRFAVELTDLRWVGYEPDEGARFRFETTTPGGRRAVIRALRRKTEVSLPIENGARLSIARERWLTVGRREKTGAGLFDESFRVEAGPARALGAKEDLKSSSRCSSVRAPSIGST